jgi:hypothetical protein
VFDAVDGPVILSADVADALGCSRETARRKLNDLYERGDLDRRKVSRRVIYWDPEEEERREPTDAARAAAVADATDGPADPPADAHGAEESDAPDPIGDALDGWEPDTQANPRTARAQTRRVAEHLRSVGEYRRKSELVDALAGDSTLGRRTWWERAVRPGLGRLAERGLVEYTRNRGWRWIGHLDRDAPEGS